MKRRNFLKSILSIPLIGYVSIQDKDYLKDPDNLHIKGKWDESKERFITTWKTYSRYEIVNNNWKVQIGP